MSGAELARCPFDQQCLPDLETPIGPYPHLFTRVEQ